MHPDSLLAGFARHCALPVSFGISPGAGPTGAGDFTVTRLDGEHLHAAIDVGPVGGDARQADIMVERGLWPAGAAQLVEAAR